MSKMLKAELDWVPWRQMDDQMKYSAGESDLPSIDKTC